MKNIVLIGSGNVATHLGLSLFRKGYKIIQVWSKQLKNANILARKLHTTSTDCLKKLKKADLYIISVKDDRLHNTIQQLNINNIIHTSGSIGIEVFKNESAIENFGVLYPLQTFNKNININLSKTPICIEANNHKFECYLIDIANTLSKNVILMNSIQRKQLHIAAVFACNFSNHMFTIADTILAKADIEFKILLPIINQTIQKIKKTKPSKVQTGPAKRRDMKIMQDHLQNLTDSQLKEIYELISNSIIQSNE